MTSQLALDLPGEDTFKAALRERRTTLVSKHEKLTKDLNRLSQYAPGQSMKGETVLVRNNLVRVIAQIKAIDILLNGLESEKQAKSA
jgi:hypothetical protein